MSSKKQEKKPVEVVVFEDPAKRRDRVKKLQRPIASSTSSSSIMRPIFDQKKAKYDIRKLAMQGMDKTEKEIAMADYLVELGAKKPGNKHVPIKEYMQELRKRKLEGGGDEADANPDEDEVKKPKYRRKRDKDDILNHVDGQIGTYRRGVQFIKGGKKR